MKGVIFSIAPAAGRMSLRRGLGLAARLMLAASALIPASTAFPETIANGSCLECHNDPALTKTVGSKPRSLTVKPEALKGSVHEGLACSDCHDGIKELPHAEKLPPPQCASCHDDAVKQYATSVHGTSQQNGSRDAAACWDCHGSHDIRPVKQPDSPVFKLNLARTCARCHSNPDLTTGHKIRNPEAASQYMESIHGRALLKLGLTQAPACSDCHGVHDIRRSSDPSSPIHHANTAKTCGHCHVGIETTYNQSIHGQLLAKGDPRGPVCTDCHTAHQIETVEGSHFKTLTDKRCGHCHEDRLEHYRETYHGKAIALGYTKVAACYDCHGYHDVLPPSDPRSHLSTNNIVATCGKCHPGSNPGFTQYMPHANPLDRKHYPLLHLVFVAMTALLIGTFGFFGLHTAFWLFRSAYLYFHDPKSFKEAKISTQQGDEWFTRFTPFERFLHILVVTSFLTLVITGMPLKFHDAEWAKALFGLLGGAQVARWLHRLAAIITFIYFALHLSERAVSLWQDRQRFTDPATGKFSFKRLWEDLTGPDSMVPHKRDWDDFIAHQKWFFGKGPRPEFERWTYWEKFDYLAVFWGVAMIGASGLIMWFPEFFTRFVPGWVINVALIVHSDEALLAAGFIFAFHFFNTHFRLEKFPMDTVIFSGRISKAEMLHERKRWFERLVAEGRLDEYRVKDEWARWKRIARSFGYGFFGVGVLLLILIVVAMTSRLIR